MTHQHALNDLTDVVTRATQYRTLAIHKDNAHYAMSSLFQHRNQVLGIPTIVLAAVVSTAIFASVASDASTGWKIVTGLVSLTAAVMAALQTFFNYSERASQHQAAARGYSSLRRRVEQFLLEQAGNSSDRSAAIKGLGEIMKAMSDLEAIEPLIADHVYEKIKTKYPAGSL